MLAIIYLDAEIQQKQKFQAKQKPVFQGYNRHKDQ
jgi:hypothetical protein